MGNPYSPLTSTLSFSLFWQIVTMSRSTFCWSCELVKKGIEKRRVVSTILQMHACVFPTPENQSGRKTQRGPLFIEGDHVQTDFIFKETKQVIFLASLTGQSHAPRIPSIVPTPSVMGSPRLPIRLLPLECWQQVQEISILSEHPQPNALSTATSFGTFPGVGQRELLLKIPATLEKSVLAHPGHYYQAPTTEIPSQPFRWDSTTTTPLLH